MRRESRTRADLEAMDPAVVVKQFLDARTTTDHSRRTYREDLGYYLDWCRSNNVNPLLAGVDETNRYVQDVNSREWADSTKTQRCMTLRSSTGTWAVEWGSPHRWITRTPFLLPAVGQWISLWARSTLATSLSS